jgi:hypothetical protein
VNATVLVERIGKGKYRASTGQPVPLTSEGKSRDYAVRRLRRLVQQRVAAGELIEVDLLPSAGANPWQEFAGIWKDHPEFETFRADIAAYRRSKRV